MKGVGYVYSIVARGAAMSLRLPHDTSYIICGFYTTFHIFSAYPMRILEM